MKRLETLEDVKKAMELNPYFYGYVCKIVEDDQEYIADMNSNDRKFYLKNAKGKLAEIMDECEDLGDMLNRLTDITKYVDDGIKDTNWMPTFDYSIVKSLGNMEDFENIIIDNDKVYRLYECYAESDDKTFIIREEFYPTLDEYEKNFDEGRETFDWQMPNQECVGWYCGSPESDVTDKFYGKL